MNYVENNQGVHADQPLKNVLIPDSNKSYRLTLFLWNPTQDAGAGTISFMVQWTKPFGGVDTETVTINLASSPSDQTMDLTIWVQSGTPIQYSVLGGGTYGAATYSYLLAMSDLARQGFDDGEGCGSSGPLIPVPIPMQRPACCGRCQRNPCCCNQGGYGGGGGGQPIIIMPQFPGPQPYPMLPPQRRMRYADDDDYDGGGPYNGPWNCDGPCP